MTEDLSGRRILVVGASAGIGLAIGSTAAADGAHVALAARSQDALHDIVASRPG